MEQKHKRLKEAAAFLFKSQSWMYKKCANKEIPYLKVGRHNVFKTEDLIAYLEGHPVLTKSQLQQSADEKLLNAKP